MILTLTANPSNDRTVDLADIDTVITDAGAPDAHRARLEAAGIEVLVA